jgi:hypothetical protein
MGKGVVAAAALACLPLAGCGLVGDLRDAVRGANVREDATVDAAEPPGFDDYLENPGMGWQEGTTLDDPVLPETVSYRRRRYGWSRLNPEEGVYDWSRLDADLAAALAQGKQHSFRIYTMRGEVYGGHLVPGWAIEKGATILASGAPDYSHCVYQREWARFVEALRQRYDGHPVIAFIDISGYGNFNEWSWNEQTTLETGTLDSQARRHLADVFIGGSGIIECRSAGGARERIAYSYPGFQTTQLLMPYAGIAESSAYVAGRRFDIGIRHDCLGSRKHTGGMRRRIGHLMDRTWRQAPIVYEFCAGSLSDRDFMATADRVLRQTHASIVHDNLRGERSRAELARLLRDVGYRFVLTRARLPRVIARGLPFRMSTAWQNLGYAPAYRKMGQRLELHVFLLDQRGEVAEDWRLPADPALWLPADPVSAEAPVHTITATLWTRAERDPGRYTVAVGVIDERTGRPINLAFTGRDEQGRYRLGEIEVSTTLPNQAVAAPARFPS